MASDDVFSKELNPESDFCRPDVLEKVNAMGGRLTRVRTVLEPSEIDAANIALLHPGKQLNGQEGEGRLRQYLKVLRFRDALVPMFVQWAKDRNWNMIRSRYLFVLGTQVDQALADSKAIIDQLEAGDKPAKSVDPNRARDNAPPPEPPAAASKGLLDLIYEQLMKTIGPTGKHRQNSVSMAQKALGHLSKLCPDCGLGG